MLQVECGAQLMNKPVGGVGKEVACGVMRG